MIRNAIFAFGVVMAFPFSASAGPDCGLYQYRAEVTEVYDGDTVTVDIDLGFDVWMKDQKLRLYGIDAPEMRGPEKPDGTISRDALRDKILGKQVMLCSYKDEKGKFGRYLATIWLNDLDVNRWLVEEGYAVPYLP